MYFRRFILLVYLVSSVCFVYANESVILTPATGGEAILQSSINGEFTSLSNIVFEETLSGQIYPDVSDLVINLPEGFEFDINSKVNVTAVTSRIQNPELNCQGGNNRTLRLGTSQSGSLSVNINPNPTSVTVRIKQATSGDCKGTLTFSGMKIRPTSVATQSGNITYNGTTNIFGIEPEETSLGVLTIIDDVEEDETPPELVLLGENIMTIEVHDEFVEPGFEAFDNVDEDVMVEVEGVVDTHVLGEYVLTYKAVDASLNETIQTRIVKVVDTTAPILRILGENPLRVKLFSVFEDPGVEVLDNYDEDISYSVSGVVDTSVVQTLTLVYSAVDQSGNVAEATRDVLVTENIPPTLNIKGPEEITIEATHPYIDLGAEAFDSLSNDISNMILVSGLPIDTSKVGMYTITYRIYFDSLHIEKTRSVRVVDTTAPTIQLIGDAEMYIQEGDTFNDPFVYAFDSVDKDLSLSVERTYIPENLSAGVYEILYSVVDSSGNSASISRTLFVREKINTTPSSQKSGTRQGGVRSSNTVFLSIDSTRNILPTTRAVLGASTVCISKPLFKSELVLEGLSVDEVIYLKQFLNQEFRLALLTNSEVTDLLIEALHIFMLSQNLSKEEMRDLLQSKSNSSCSS